MWWETVFSTDVYNQVAVSRIAEKRFCETELWTSVLNTVSGHITHLCMMCPECVRKMCPETVFSTDVFNSVLISCVCQDVFYFQKGLQPTYLLLAML